MSRRCDAASSARRRRDAERASSDVQRDPVGRAPAQPVLLAQARRQRAGRRESVCGGEHAHRRRAAGPRGSPRRLRERAVAVIGPRRVCAATYSRNSASDRRITGTASRRSGRRPPSRGSSAPPRRAQPSHVRWYSSERGVHQRRVDPEHQVRVARPSTASRPGTARAARSSPACTRAWPRCTASPAWSASAFVPNVIR